MTRPIGTPISTSTASESCRLASIVSGTASVAPSSIERAGVICVARAGDQRHVRQQAVRRPLTTASLAAGESMVTTTARAVSRLQWRRYSGRAASP